MPPPASLVDLTGDTSSDGNDIYDDVITVAQRLPLYNSKSDTIQALAPSSWDNTIQARPLVTRKVSSPPRLLSVAIHPSSNPLSAKPSPDPRANSTPSRTTRFSTRGEVPDSQSPPDVKFKAQSLSLSEPQAIAPSQPTFQAPSQPAPQHNHPTPQSSTRSSRGQQTPKHVTPRRSSDWTVEKLTVAISSLAQDVSKGHARLVEFLLDEAGSKAPEPRNLSTFDDFADMKSAAMDANAVPPPGTVTMVIKLKQHSGEHGKSKNGGRRFQFPITCIKTADDAVPRYRFHHVEIRKNILTPNTMLNFVPHLRDVDPNSAEEKKYSNWLTELEKLDSQSGFKTQDRGQKVLRRARDEYAATLSMYLESWLEKLAIDGCTKANLIRYMASQPQEDAITPQQKSNILDTYSHDADSPQAMRAAQMFTEAFDSVFDDRGQLRSVTLRDILMLDKSVETIVDNKRAKETPSSQKHRDQDLIKKLEGSLASYSILGCLICFSHDCEHGEFDAENQRGTFSLEGTGGLALTLQEKWQAQLEALKSQQGAVASKPAHQPCENQCYRSYNTGDPYQDIEPWTEAEVGVLERLFATIGHSTSLKAQCFVAAVLGRKCWDVHRKLNELKLTLPLVEPRGEPPKFKPVTWYDRKKKQLLGDWQDSTTSHEHAIRELLEPCHHDGPCTAANGCPCATAYPHPILCERFCHCTAETCALKFTGCACHSSGKTCLQRQKEGKPCICVQLNRECDPVLCRGCGARDRADPENAQDEQLHSSGCQNVAMQRGAAKTVLLGKSQLEGCGYGLFTAEDIAQDEFVIEYTGELITHDEGVRREARRGDVFDQEANSSYLFTLLEHEGIWVDAAIYGNLSRYINHASENEKKGCNIMPKILYVNGEFRIKFSALRDIKAGEELFFNYGDNFPNLTKKLLEQDEDKPGEVGAKRKNGAALRNGAARKGTGKREGDAGGYGTLRHGKGWPEGDVPPADDEDVADDWEDHSPTRRRSKKRGGRRPGAGRKKKQPVEEGAVAPAAVPASIPTPEDTLGTPARRRQPKRSLNSGDFQRSGSAAAGSEIGVATGGPAVMSPLAPVKKPSKRGGARPGAGRKPKHPRPPGAVKPDAKSAAKAASKVRSTASPAQEAAVDTADSQQHETPLAGQESEPLPTSGAFREDLDELALAAQLESHPASASALSSGITSVASSRPASSGMGIGMDTGMTLSAPSPPSRKRKSPSESETGHEAVASITASTGLLPAGPFRQDTFQPIDDASSVSIRSGSRGFGDDEEGSPGAESRARKRQRPLRYRNDEE